MWKMTLKQRRRHSALVAELDVLKRNPYSQVPKGYTFGETEEEDKKYNDAFETLKSLVEQLHELEVAVRDGG